MKYWKAGIWFLVAFLLQNTFLNLFSIMDSTPNLLLSAVIVFSFIYEIEVYGIVFGAVFGVLYDICWGSTIGPTAISLVVVAFILIFVREYVTRNNVPVALFSFALSICIFCTLYWCFQSFSGNTIGYIHAMKESIIGSCYTWVISTLVYFIYIKLNKEERKDRFFG